MNKNLFLILFLFPFFIFSQSESEMLDAGIKKGTVKTIMKKFDGSLSDAINKWADSGNGKLSQKLVESAKKLGFNEVYLNSKLKLARKERLKQGILGTIAAATVVAAASAGGAGGGGGGGDYLGNNSSSYSPYYYNESYDYSGSDLTYDVSSMSSIDTNYFDTYDSSPFSSTTYDYSANPVYNDFMDEDENAQDSNFDNSFQMGTPLIYGSSSSYVDGNNTYNTGFDETGLLNIYDSSGMTIGAVKKDRSGYGVYKDGIMQTYTANPDNDGISTTYSGGIAISASKYESDGSISHYDSSGMATGYSKKVRGGYENYDSSGMLKSFTSTEDRDYNPLEGIEID